LSATIRAAGESWPEITGSELGRRLLDIAGAVILVVLSAPILLVGMLVVRLADGRPIFFGHQRLGRNGQPFRCWKLRTMSVGAEEALERDPTLHRLHRHNDFKLPSSHDPRVAPWGRLLRRTYVDETPQLFNVLAGRMSLVGPRPIVREELELFGPDGEALLTVKPGIFGAWSSLGRSRPPYPLRAQMELEYVRERTWRHDVRILARSVRAVLQGQGDG
jgi:undecaprenyl-phosphate galactose phosphotransferase